MESSSFFQKRWRQRLLITLLILLNNAIWCAVTISDYPYQVGYFRGQRDTIERILESFASPKNRGRTKEDPDFERL